MADKQYWFSHCYRRNLVDMHIEDWDPVFLSRFDPKEYIANLQKAHIEAPMLYLQSHVGHCYWPTKSGHMHSALQGREDLMRQLVTLCQDAGMHVVGYYSLIYNTVEEDKHPDWRIFTEDGKSARERGGRYGHCCPNNPAYRDFVVTQIHEMADYFPGLSGMFYDMTFWPGVCQCEYCRERYLKETGRTELPNGKLPSPNWGEPTWMELQALRVKWMGEFARFVTEETRAAMPGITVEHNYANAVAAGDALCCSTEAVNEWCDYAGGDLYGDLYNHSFTAKYYDAVTKNKPLEYMTCRCDKSLGVHTVTKTEEQLAVEVMLTAAHHGASFIIDAIDPAGTLDSRVYDRVGKVFEGQMPYEKYFTGDMVKEVGVYYATTGRYNSRGVPACTNKTAAISLTKTMIEEHIPVGIVANTLTGDLSGYKLICAPHIAGISDANRADLVRYVEAGGNLYFSGGEDAALLQMFFGGKLTGYTEERAVYMAPTEAAEPLFDPFTRAYPFPTEASLPILEGANATVLATMTMPYTKPTDRRFASIHSNPPGIPTEIPALLTAKHGKGTVIWSAAAIENDGRRAHKNLLLSILQICLDKAALTIRTTAPRQVELVTFRDGEALTLSAVDLLCTDELLPIPAFTIEVASATPKKVRRLGPSECEIPSTYENGYIRFPVTNLVMFDMYAIE